MDQNPLNFSNKKERNDFLIAITVIVFFGLLFWWLFSGNTHEDATEVAKDKIAKVTEDLDRDNDGIKDKDDRCPQLKGVPSNNGCPLDTDSDGIYDADDLCPKYAGEKENKGCPADSDGDGIHNGIDKCPNLNGVIANDGCPADTDGDGVYDEVDKCPTRPGTEANAGCPKVELSNDEKAILLDAVKTVEFETGSAILKKTSTKALDQIVSIMKKYSAYNLAIGGHTDNQGDPKKNYTLSGQRASSAKAYLVTKGIDSDRISSEGFGSSLPVTGNDTPQGRQKNRRVEFEFNY